MNEANVQLLAAARSHVTELFNQRMKPEFVFHSIEHTEDVVEACSHMADHYQLPENDRLVLMLSAWFHDVGYLSGHSEGHEELSAQMATQFLHDRHVDEATIQRVVSCIQATKMPQSPISLIEKILCDADLYHLATDDFKARNQLLKQERENVLGQKISKKDWRKSNIRFLEQHKYFTDYGQERLEPKKMDNLYAIDKKKPEKLEEKQEAEQAFPYLPVTEDGRDQKILDKNTERGIQTMFRTTSNNHFELSSLADGKGNIMISVNSIILSITLAVLVARIGHYQYYIFPTVLLVAVSMGSIIYAILATRPSISIGRFTEEDIRNKKTNLLFFGNFHQMELNEYQWAMNEMLKDREYLYNSMIKDIYFLGVVLARKYRFLRISYTIFMWGMIAVVLAFAVVAILYSTGSTTGSTAPLIDY